MLSVGHGARAPNGRVSLEFSFLSLVERQRYLLVVGCSFCRWLNDRTLLVRTGDCNACCDSYDDNERLWSIGGTV